MTTTVTVQDSSARRCRPALLVGRAAALLVGLTVLLLAGCAGSGTAGSAGKHGAASRPLTGASGRTSVSGPPTPPTTDGMVSVQGHSLSFDCRGAGSPTVVFLAGLDNDSSVWDQALTGLSAVHSCRYDRVNTGGSSQDPGQHGIADRVAELRGFLTAAKVSPPYLLVGHSMGGLIAMMYAEAHPEEISGLLLVEGHMPFEHQLDVQASTPDQLRALRQSDDDNQERVRFCEANTDADPQLAKHLPDVPIVYTYGALQTLPPQWRPGAYVARLKAWMASLPQGSIVDVAAGHGIPVDAPDAVAAQVRRLAR